MNFSAAAAMPSLGRSGPPMLPTGLRKPRTRVGKQARWWAAACRLCRDASTTKFGHFGRTNPNSPPDGFLEFDEAGLNILLHPADNKSRRAESFRVPEQFVPFFMRYLERDAAAPNWD